MYVDSRQLLRVAVSGCCTATGQHDSQCNCRHINKTVFLRNHMLVYTESTSEGFNLKDMIVIAVCNRTIELLVVKPGGDSGFLSHGFIG